MKPDTGLKKSSLLTPDQICDAVAKVMGVSRRGLTIRRTTTNSTWSRRLAIALSYCATPCTQKQLSHYFNCNQSVVCAAHKSLSAEIEPERKVAELERRSREVSALVESILQEAKAGRNANGDASP
jgi:chromosomal replication initiation ATPase DnaA